MITIEIEPVIIPTRGTSLAPIVYIANSSGLHNDETITLANCIVKEPKIAAKPKGIANFNIRTIEDIEGPSHCPGTYLKDK